MCTSFEEECTHQDDQIGIRSLMSNTPELYLPISSIIRAHSLDQMVCVRSANQHKPIKYVVWGLFFIVSVKT